MNTVSGVPILCNYACKKYKESLEKYKQCRVMVIQIEYMKMHEMFMYFVPIPGMHLIHHNT